ncbi:unnamed protein product [Protopolystoma xenopodis]|uniref:Uncharacterized protein n=1 Tax=Protopolystoma xenopodis TaxID=117903 RepID=A0A3S5ABV8_9PLAT|nr:unnamed protein product [Protopolystoma xenopodis]
MMQSVTIQNIPLAAPPDWRLLRLMTTQSLVNRPQLQSVNQLPEWPEAVHKWHRVEQEQLVARKDQMELELQMDQVRVLAQLEVEQEEEEQQQQAVGTAAHTGPSNTGALGATGGLGQVGQIGSSLCGSSGTTGSSNELDQVA